jgi:hypothetical protein
VSSSQSDPTVTGQATKRAPIALFVYNRPSHTQQTVQALLKNGPAAASDLFVFADAPANPAADSAVQQVRDYVHRIAGFRSVTVVERPENFGLANSIIDGVTRLCEQYGRVIVLEDDLITSPYFLDFMNDALDRYESQERVMQVAGYMFSGPLTVDEDALLLPFITSWGWATWRRAWRHFDPQASGYERLRNDPALKAKFNLNGHYDYFRMLQRQQQGMVDSWAIRWYLSVFLREGVALYPRKTLVHNSGFDGSGVNCAVSDFPQDEMQAQFRVASMPSRIEVSSHAAEVFANMPVARLSWSSIRRRVAGMLQRSAGR